MHKGVAETAGEFISLTLIPIPFSPNPLTNASIHPVIGTADELTGQAVHAFVTLKP
jgi:hypothetical protein